MLTSPPLVQSQPACLSQFLQEESPPHLLAPSTIPTPSASPSPSPLTALTAADFSHPDFSINTPPFNRKLFIQIPSTTVRDFLRPKPPFGVQVVINLKKQRLILFRYKQVLLESPISSGRPGYRTASGNFEVTQKDLHHFSTLYGYFKGGKYRPASMKYFVRYNGSEGLHAGDLPGYAASHGCVRLPTNKAAAIFKRVGIGTPVTVLGNMPKENQRMRPLRPLRPPIPPRPRPPREVRNISNAN